MTVQQVYWRVDKLKELVTLWVPADEWMTIEFTPEQYEAFRNKGDVAYEALKKAKAENLADALRVANEVREKIRAKGEQVNELRQEGVCQNLREQ